MFSLITHAKTTRVDNVIRATVDDVMVASCPTHCMCTNESVANLLVIDCRGRSDSNSSLIIGEIDTLLTSGGFDLLSELNIKEAPMNQVPLSICQLRGLRRLLLSNNRLKVLPRQCFNEMSSLEEFQANDNELTEIVVHIELFSSLFDRIQLFLLLVSKDPEG